MKLAIGISQLRPKNFAGLGKSVIFAPHEFVMRQTFRRKRHEPKA